MDITLVITTYNRAHVLDSALQSLAACRIPPNLSVETIVVDNNSTDNTTRVVSKWHGQCGPVPLRYVFERQQGVSHARNRGLEEATGHWVAFMDDDQKIDSDYLATLPRAFAETRAQCVGGRVKYLNTDNLPKWLPPLISTVGQLDLGDSIVAINAKDFLLKGGNIAFQTEFLRTLGGFDIRLGRTGGNLLAAEEDDVQNRILHAGGKVAYHPALIQFHQLMPEKLQKHYWRRHAYGYGRTQYLTCIQGWQRASRFFGIPRSLYLSLIKSLFIWGSAIRFLDSAKLFHRQLDIIELLGVMVEARRQEKSS